MNKGPVLILGARSDIGMAIARCFAQHGHPVQLAARGVETLEPARADLEVQFGVGATLHEFDALQTDSHSAFVEGFGRLADTAISAIGVMGEQGESERDLNEAARVMRSNFEAPAGILAELANRFEARGTGTLVGISSVAGERGRATNYVYGSAKAGFTAFLSGLRNRLADKNVHVVTVLPGFVATKMTEGLDLPAKLTAQPDEVAQAVYRAVTKSRNVVYVRPVWWLIMAIIKAIPERVFKGLSL